MIKVNDLNLFNIHNTENDKRFFLVSVDENNSEYYCVIDDTSGYPIGYRDYEKIYSLDRATKLCDGLNDFDKKMIESGNPGWES